GPMITSFSPGWTARLTPFTAVRLLKRLVMFSSWMRGLTSLIDPCPVLDLFEEEGEEGREDQVDDGGQDEGRHVEVGIEHLVRGPHQLDHGNGGDQGRVFDQGDELVADGRHEP